VFPFLLFLLPPFRSSLRETQGGEGAEKEEAPPCQWPLRCCCCVREEKTNKRNQEKYRGGGGEESSKSDTTRWATWREEGRIDFFKFQRGGMEKGGKTFACRDKNWQRENSLPIYIFIRTHTPKNGKPRQRATPSFLSRAMEQRPYYSEQTSAVGGHPFILASTLLSSLHLHIHAECT
jgi:hypothetical protein